MIYVDNYGNAFVNITESYFNSVLNSRRFAITFRSPNYRITKLSKAYKDVPEGEMLAFFSSTGYLEIAINQSHAASLLGLKHDTTVLVEMQ